MRSVGVEIYKVFTYRAPLLVMAGALLLIVMWDATILVRGAASGDAHHRLDSALALGGIVLPLAYFALPILIINGDVNSGTLRPSLVANPNRYRVMAAKWVASLICSMATALAASGALTLTLALTSGGTSIAPVLVPAMLKVVVQAGLCTLLALGLHVLTGYRWGAWILLGLLIWMHLIERLLSSALPGRAGMAASPFRLVDFWVRDRWQGFGHSELAHFGFMPLAVYAGLVAAFALGLFAIFSDSSARPWGRIGVLS